MTPTELKQIIAELRLSQPEFARLVDVSVSAVAQWLSGARGIPGPVGAYLGLLRRLPPAVVEYELNRIKTGNVIMRNGIYTVAFAGSHGFGSATLTFKDGIVYGIDSAGGSYDGTCVYDASVGRARVALDVLIKANRATVAGGIVQPFDWSMKVEALMDPNSDSGDIDVGTNVGPAIRARYSLVRTLPAAA